MPNLTGQGSFLTIGCPAEPGNPYMPIVDYIVAHAVGSVLDMGGGKGAYAKKMLEMGYNVTLAEINKEYLSVAQNNGIPVIDMNLTSWKDIEGSFDTVLMIEVLEHLPDYEEFFSKVYACARKKIIFTIPCCDDFKVLFNFGITYNHIAVTDHLHYLTTTDISFLLNKYQCEYKLTYDGFLFPNSYFSSYEK